MLSEGVCSLWLCSAPPRTLSLVIPVQLSSLNVLCAAWLPRGPFRGSLCHKRWDCKAEVHSPVLIIWECYSACILYFVLAVFRKVAGERLKVHHCTKTKHSSYRQKIPTFAVYLRLNNGSFLFQGSQVHPQMASTNVF